MSIRRGRESPVNRVPATPSWGLRSPAAQPPKMANPRMTEAIKGLWLRRPELSARGPAPGWLLPALLLGSFLAAFLFVIEPTAMIIACGALLLLPFAGATALRLAAAVEVLMQPPHTAASNASGRAEASALPRYAVLVPLYDEAEVLPHLVFGLSRLDYPRERLDVLLVLESRDEKTRRAAARLALPSHMRVVVVPQGGPRTKPKALNYALTFTDADLVVVYDAEDRPEPGQLRAAVREFSEGGSDLACVQARLNVYNPYRSFFTRGIMAQTPVDLKPC